MPERRFRPGHRSNPQARGTGKLSDRRYAWLSTTIGQFVIMYFDENNEDNLDEETGPTIRLFLPRHGGRPISFNFTALTHEEFVLLKQFFDILFELAEPVVLERDRVAQDAAAEGDDSFARLYRAVPRLVVRERTIRKDGSGISSGSTDVLNGSGVAGNDSSSDLNGGVRGTGDELADDESEEGSTENNGTKTD